MKPLKVSKKDYKAVIDSIKHWEKDVIKPLKRGEKITRGVYMDDSCPLCKLQPGPDCSHCPYYRFYKHPCDARPEGHWSHFDRVMLAKHFFRKRAIKKAIEMRNALAKIIGEKEISE